MDEKTYSEQITAPEDAGKLRTRGKRMLELATRAYCEQHYDFARLLTRLVKLLYGRGKRD